jgi:cytochrome P450
MTPSSIPGFPPMPILGATGNALRIFTEGYAFALEGYRRYGSVFALTQGDARTVAVIGAEHARTILTDTETYFTVDASTLLVKLQRDTPIWRVWENGLLQMNGKHHDQQRRLMMPALHKKRIEGYRDDMVKYAEQKLAGWQPGQTYKILDEMRDMTLNIAVKTLLGIDPDNVGRELRHKMAQFAALTQSPLSLVLPLNLPGLPYRRLMNIAGWTEKHVQALINQKRATGEDHGDALSMLMQAHDEDGTRLTDAELIGQTETLFIAGHETSATALTWALFFLAQHPACLAQVLDEIERVCGDAPPTLEQINQMPLMEGVIKEALRLFPPLNALSRITQKPVEIGGYAIPQGATIVLGSFITHRIEPVYEQPFHFMPERWQHINPSPYEFQSFGGGARMCIGATFAMLEMKIVLPMLLRRFRFNLAPNTKVDARGLIFTTPTNHLPMQLERANGQPPQRAAIRGNVTEFVQGL